MNPFPFRKDAHPDLTRTISEIVAPRDRSRDPQGDFMPPKKPEKYGDKTPPKTPPKTARKPKADKWGGREPYVKNDRNPYVREGVEGDTHGGGATSPKRNGAASRKRKTPAPVVGVPTTPRVTEPLKTEGVVHESHSRAQLEKLGVAQLRDLKKKYEGAVLKGDRRASETLATVRGLLRSKGGGHALDEGAPTTAREWEAANRPGRDAATALRRGMERFRKKYGTAKPAPAPPSKPVKEEMTPCEAAALKRLKSANTSDLEEKPGAAGEAAHKRLHKTIGKVLKGK